MVFEFLKVRFHLRAADRLRFPAGRAANVLRGAFGASLRRVVCVPECAGPATCARRLTCAYARTFEPRAARGEGPSGLADWPRPFVFRSAHLDGRTILPGQTFHFDFHVFDYPPRSGSGPLLPDLVRAFTLVAESGFGPGRGRAELIRTEEEPVRLPLDGPPPSASRATLRFVTPTELKGGAPDAPPETAAEFRILFARIRDRLSTLNALYGSGPLGIDFRAWGERAAAVRLIRSDLHHVHLDRRSSRTGQVHPLGGFVGEAEYAGELGEFIPYLAAAQWTGVGRQTVWGKGEIRLLATA
ncbi:MAG TPA: CRISPR system precrRNA processing endoribonuclease RAMP protein Cas6 [Bryobacteraceae bacterium]|nr:CRISPR system precrRNA processing endoribonuclease RAMP protein Cas6 [Bryobacteraceae bacterium]